MLQGKPTKLNLLIEESATEKLYTSKIFLWLMTNTRLVMGVAAITFALFLAAALWLTKSDARFQEDYIKIQSNIEKMQESLVQGKNQDAKELWEETKPLINKHLSFMQAFQAKSGELLLLLESYDEALPLMQSTLKRTQDSLGDSITSFVKITEQTARGDLPLALKEAKETAEKNDSEMPIMLRAYNLLQIPAFAKSLNDTNEELSSINNIFSLIEGREELGTAVYFLSQMIQSEKTTYLDYLKIRKYTLTP